MILDLADVRIRARLSPLSPEKFRLTLDYPIEIEYRKRVMTALSDLLRPASATLVCDSLPDASGGAQ